jgi:hypothetical protein
MTRGPIWENRNRTKKSQNLKSSLELTYRMYKLCKLLLVCTFQNHYDENIWTNGLVFRECKHIKNIFEDVYFTKNSFHTTLTITGRGINLSSFALISH